MTRFSEIQRGSFCLNSLSFCVNSFSFARCHVCWCMQACNVYMDSTIIFYFLFCRDSSITWQTIFNQGESHQRMQHAGGIMGSQAWTDGWTKTNIVPKNIHTLFFLVAGDLLSILYHVDSFIYPLFSTAVFSLYFTFSFVPRPLCLLSILYFLFSSYFLCVLFFLLFPMCTFCFI